MDDDVVAEQRRGDGERAVAELDEASHRFVGRWRQLVSQTNWEKGRIIRQWREALRSAGASASDYSDEAWSRRVGGVSGQHVGRLRRVEERFGRVWRQYEGLYWSHFQAALDWDDAEMWLEGAVQNGWSVSQMRRRRWEILGDATAPKPLDDEIVSSELDEDFELGEETPPGARTIGDRLDEVRPTGPKPAEGRKSRKKPEAPTADRADSFLGGDEPEASPGDPAPPAVRPFENLAELPEDLADALEALKLAILRHKADRWRSISCADVLAALDSLKQLAAAPRGDEQAS